MPLILTLLTDRVLGAMARTSLRAKIRELEANLLLLKRAVEGEPDFRVDEKAWENIRRDAKKIRKVLYKEEYGS